MPRRVIRWDWCAVANDLTAVVGRVWAVGTPAGASSGCTACWSSRQIVQLTVTVCSTRYAVQVLEGTGQTWTLDKRYSDFERLHMALEGVLWSKDTPPDPPFPPKEMLPNVARRSEKLAKYLGAVCAMLPDMPEQSQVVVVRFLCAAYRPVSNDPRVPLVPLDPATPPKAPTDEAGPVEVEPPSTPVASQRKCPQCPDALNHVEYVPGAHNPEGYKSGWQCDQCHFSSTDGPRSQRARFRYLHSIIPTRA